MQEGFSSTLRDSEKDTSYLEDRVEAQPKQSSKKKKKIQSEDIVRDLWDNIE